MTTIQSSALLVEFARRLLEVYQNLLRSSRQFVAEPAADTLALFLDERDFALEEIRDLERELLVHSREAFPGVAADLVGVLQHLEKGKDTGRENSTLFHEIRETLTQLVSADKEVQARLNSDKTAISEQLKQIRRGSQSLKGYTPSDSTGSCFIDKVK
jgi:hypothetical protein